MKGADWFPGHTASRPVSRMGRIRILVIGVAKYNEMSCSTHQLPGLRVQMAFPRDWQRPNPDDRRSEKEWKDTRRQQ
ncbi:unnamed protein product [Caenorhabditis nigoni]